MRAKSKHVFSPIFISFLPLAQIFQLMRGLISDIFIAIYLAITLLIRFYLEPQLQGRFLISIALGAFALLFLWALIKSKVLRPNYFGLLKR